MTKAFAYFVALLILLGAFYALVINPYVVEADTKLWLTGLAGAASTFIFGDQASSRGAHQALQSPNQTVTASGGDPPMEVTVTPQEPTETQG